MMELSHVLMHSVFMDGESYVLEGHFEPILFLKLHLSLWFQYASHFIILSNSKCVQVS